MSDKITLDRETFKALAADTRIEILKRLEMHKETLTDLAHGMSMSPSTIKEHADKLSQAGLIEQIDSDTKWKYYKLTEKGRSVLNPYETKVWILLATSALLLMGSVYALVRGVVPAPVEKLAETARGEGLLLAAEPSATQVVSIPYMEIALVVLFAVMLGVAVGYLLRRR